MMHPHQTLLPLGSSLAAQAAALLEKSLLHPPAIPWQYQGLGMIRVYLGDDRADRLHVWHPKLALPHVSRIHDHPWDFRSQVLAGAITDREFVAHGEPATAVTHYMGIIEPGEKAHLLEDPQSVNLVQIASRTYRPKEDYSHDKTDIHASYPIPGTVTFVRRVRSSQGADRARVFWPIDVGAFVSAAPRPATSEEIRMACAPAYDRLMAAGV